MGCTFAVKVLKTVNVSKRKHSPVMQAQNIIGEIKGFLGILDDSVIVLSTRYGKVRVFINKDLINRDHLSTRPYQQRPLINKV